MTTRIERATIAAQLGEWTAALIEMIAAEATRAGLSCYLVGGAVRDLLLGRSTVDLDFAIEGDAIGFASRLVSQYGGGLSTHPPFGTAAWSVSSAALDFGVPRPPDQFILDFAMTRAETYLHPGALPVVSAASLADDLIRRDFTINAVALQLSPEFGAVIDPHGGLTDLAAGRLRVLHDRSFIDDPTRILRGARFAARFGFAFDDEAIRLIHEALPVIDEIAGDRLRVNLSLILSEDQFADALHLLESWGVLAKIGPRLTLYEELVRRMTAVRQYAALPDSLRTDDMVQLMWIVWLARFPINEFRQICGRLNFTRAWLNAIMSMHAIQGEVMLFDKRGNPFSAFAASLHHVPLIVISAAWLISDSDRVRSALTDYVVRWRSFRPFTTGDDLKARGLRPAVCFRRILNTLFAAHVDGLVKTRADEDDLIDRMIADGVCAE